MNATAHDSGDQTRKYLMIFGVLAVLTIVTVAIGYMSLPIGLGITVALIIASVKGSLVATVFMHLASEVKPILWLLVLTFIFLFIMFILFIGSFMDQWGESIVS